MLTRKLTLVGGLLAATLASSSEATVIQFVPPNDPVGLVFTVNTNDGYSSGRGMAFEAGTDLVLSSIGIYHDLTAVNLSYSVSETLSRVGQVDAGETVLRSGSAIVTTSGLEWIDFAFAPLTLQAGQFYSFEFSFAGNGNQNFFYTQLGFDDFDQGGLLFINGTQAGNTVNFVIPAMRADLEAVPEPASLLLLGSGLFGLAARRRRSA